MLISKLLVWIIRNARPLLGPTGCCKFTVTCSKFAIIQLQEKHLMNAIWEITRRLISCRPF